MQSSIQAPTNKWQAHELAYCSNVHPGDELPAVMDNLVSFFQPVRQQRQLEQMASGLWLSANTVKKLSGIHAHNQLAAFKASLVQNGVRLTSLNGFPYGDFHQDVVKQKVYSPCWATQARLDYSVELATILADCLPEGKTSGAISTLPLGYAVNWSDTHQYKAVQNLLRLIWQLERLEQKSGKCIRFALEMEPDCVLEETQQLINFFHQHLIPQAKLQGIAENTVLRYLGCCYDTCHQAVMFEDCQQSLNAIHSAGIVVAKIQISNALSVRLENKAQVDALCHLFSDKKFLHQCKIMLPDENHKKNQMVSLPDLDQSELALLLKQYDCLQCRIHYHVPIHKKNIQINEHFEVLTTQDAILSTLDFLSAHKNLKPELEIETYTWLNFLHQGALSSGDLITGLVQEFDFLTQYMQQKGLLCPNR
ncbi:metabolite traffic protein EboE [Catenovulum sediminis]|uniref:metabolite traffic protein EboE n=1 Tax=Catenovulum sediminis TaxID=1740262 RepID=UPI001180B01A|nr:metabolite traffic protein EboE [Catenovulum sediminis]